MPTIRRGAPSPSAPAGNPRQALLLASIQALNDAVAGGDLGLARDTQETIGRLLDGGARDEAVSAPEAKAEPVRPGLAKPRLDVVDGGKAAGGRSRGRRG